MGWLPASACPCDPWKDNLESAWLSGLFWKIGDKKFSSENPERLPTNAADETTVAVSRGHADVAAYPARKNCRSTSPSF